MIDRILDLIAKGWEYIVPFEVVRVYEAGAVLRLGKFHRSLEPGFAWKWPFIEEVITTNTVLTTIRLSPQTLTTKDDQSVVVGAIVKYKVEDVEAYLTQIWDQHDVLADVTMGAVREAVSLKTWPEILAAGIDRDVLDVVRKQVNKYGFRIHSVTFTDFGRVRSLRLIQQQAVNLDN